MRKLLAILAIGGALAFGAPESASAQEQDGLVNVVVGDVTILEDVNVAVAVNAVVTACDLVDVGNVQVALLARATQVDRSGRSTTICRTEGGPVEITQNAGTGGA
ncbi:MAG TPA: hypothetical protein VJ596_02870 [Gemmatimonadaceae bacterium]|nr:hypothetical protein [Gemmatimonadaceae bacterium]